MSVETGDYLLFAYDLEGRPIGQQSIENYGVAVVLQPRGTEPHEWHIQHVRDDKYILTLGHLVAMKKDDRVVLVPLLPGPNPFLWKIIPADSPKLPGPPHSPLPFLYGIFVPDESNEAWFAPKGDPVLEIPVTIFDKALVIQFFRVPK